MTGPSLDRTKRRNASMTMKTIAAAAKAMSHDGRRCCSGWID